MFLKELSLIHFKNYEEARLEFSPGVNCFTGPNGSGKTNLLDAIHYLSLCKSYFNPIDSQNIQHEAPFFVIQGIFEEKGQEDNIYCGMKRGQKKVFKRNQQEYERLADHIGSFPLVMISPADSELITEGSESRRRFLDGVISQYNHTYLDQLIRYNRALSHRNSLLKTIHGNGFDQGSLDAWNMQLVANGVPVYEERRKFIEQFVPIFQEFYAFVSGGKEIVELDYKSRLSDHSFEELLEQSLQRDLALQHTTAGIHKDDLEFLMNKHSVKKTGSQGQQKTFLLALKLAQFEFIQRIKGVAPLLLLDDINDKLDEARVKKLMELVSGNRFGQVFITDTHPRRLPDLFKDMGMDCKVWEVHDGQLIVS